MQLVLHAHVQPQLDQIRSHPFGSYLFVGPIGRGRYTAARELMRRLNCHELSQEPCSSCSQLESGNHPSFIVVDAGDKASIGIETIRSLRNELALAQYGGEGVRMIVIDGADTLTPEAQNAILKLMEEPPAATLIILVAESRDKLLATVRSRCQTVVFGAPDEVAMMAWLGQRGVEPKLARRAATIAPGLPGLASTLARDAVELETRERLAELGATVIGQSVFERLMLVRQLSDDHLPLRQFVASLETAVRRLLRQGSDVIRQAARLQAVETCYLRLDAHVTPRLAVEALLVEV